MSRFGCFRVIDIQAFWVVGFSGGFGILIVAFWADGVWLEVWVLVVCATFWLVVLMDSFWIDFALRVGFVLVTICGFCVSDSCRGLLWLTVAVLLDYVVCGCGVFARYWFLGCMFGVWFWWVSLIRVGYFSGFDSVGLCCGVLSVGELVVVIGFL